MQCLKEFLETYGLLVASATGTAGLIALLPVIRNRLSPLKPGGGGFYYSRKGKKPYCPCCYEGSKSRARVINKQCVKCGKSFGIPPVVIEACPGTKPKITIG